MLTTEPIDTFPADLAPPERCVIVVEETLAPGLAANAAAVLALTLGARLPDLPGPPILDAAGRRHPGLIPIGLPVLRASTDALADAHRRALAAAPAVGVVAFPAFGQTTTDYAAFSATMADTAEPEQALAGLALAGAARAVRRLTGSFGLLR